MSRKEISVWVVQCDWCHKETGPIFSKYSPAIPSDWDEMPRGGHPAVPESMSTVVCPECAAEAKKQGRL